MSDRFRVVPAAYVVLLRPGAAAGEEALLQLREGTGFMDGRWACGAAGHVEAGESVLQAAVREAREELGVELDDLEPLTVMHRTGGNGLAVDERVDWFFGCRSWRGEPRLQESDKAADLRWWPLGALPDTVVPHEGRVLRAHATGNLPSVTTFGFEAAEAVAQAEAARGAGEPPEPQEPQEPQEP